MKTVQVKTQQQQQQPFYSPLSGTTRVGQYEKKHSPSPTHHPDHHPIPTSPPSTTINSITLAQTMRPPIPPHNLSPRPLVHLPGSGASTPHSIHFSTQPVPSSRSTCTCPQNCNLSHCSINIISSIPSLSFNSLLGTLVFYLNKQELIRR